MKTVMLVGGGVQEVRAVEFAQGLGYRVVVTDRSPDAPCVPVADESYVVDGRDTEALVGLGRDLRAAGRLDGAFTLTELVTSVAAITEDLSLPGASVRSAEICQDKGMAKLEWLRQGIETPRGSVVDSRESAHSAWSEIGAVGIIKPVESFGAVGVARIESGTDIDRYFDAQHGSGPWVVEQLVTGISHDVNGLFDGEGVFHPQGIADRRFVPETFAEHEVHAPTHLDEGQQADLYDLLRRCADTFGIESGPVKGDAILSDEGFRMLEIAPRLHGPKMSLYALPESGQNFWGDFFSVITGGKVKGPPPEPTRYFQSTSIASAPGRIVSITGVEDVRSWDGIVDVMVFRGPGDIAPPVWNSTDVVGYVLASTPSREETADLLRRAIETIGVTVEGAR